MERVAFASFRGVRATGLGPSRVFIANTSFHKISRNFSSVLSKNLTYSNRPKSHLCSNTHQLSALKFSTFSQPEKIDNVTGTTEFSVPDNSSSFAAEGSSFDVEGASSAIEVVTADPVTHWRNVEFAMSLLNSVHETSGLPWWATIVCTTLLVRTAMMPLVIRQFKVAAKLAKMKPELDEATAEFKRLKATGELDAEKLSAHQAKTGAIMKKHGANPLSALVVPLVSGPIFMTFFFTLRAIGERYPSLGDGGMLWFQNLAEMDHYYALPIISSLSLLMVIELGSEGGQAANQMQPMIKNVFRGVAFFTPFAVYTFPAATFMYWITSNLYSLTQGKLLRSAWGKRTFNIPDIQPIDPIDSNPYMKKKPKKEKVEIPDATPETITYFSDAKEVEATTPNKQKKKTRRR